MFLFDIVYTYIYIYKKRHVDGLSLSQPLPGEARLKLFDALLDDVNGLAELGSGFRLRFGGWVALNRNVSSQHEVRSSPTELPHL